MIFTSNEWSYYKVAKTIGKQTERMALQSQFLKGIDEILGVIQPTV